MTLRVARIYVWLAVLALLGSVAALAVHFGFLVAVALALLLLVLVALAAWGIRRGSGWGLVLWVLTMVTAAVPLLVAGIPHSTSITSTEYGTGAVVTEHFEQPGSRGWLSLGLAHLLLAFIGLAELTARFRRRRRRGEPRLGGPLSPPQTTGGPAAWVWVATAVAGGLLGWINRASGGPVVPLGLLAVASVAWGAVLPARWWCWGLLLGGGVLAGEALRYLDLGLTGWDGRQGLATLAVLAPAVVGAYAGVVLRAAIDRLGRRPEVLTSPWSSPGGNDQPDDDQASPAAQHCASVNGSTSWSQVVQWLILNHQCPFRPELTLWYRTLLSR